MRTKKALIWSAVLAALIMLSSCAKTSPPSSFHIVFTPKWGSDNFKLNTIYHTSDAYVSFSSFGLYMSHIKLVRTDNTEIEVDSAVMLVYANNAFTINLAPIKGSYKALKFSIGLDSFQNTISPANAPTNDPVYFSSALYWSTQQHLFIQLGGLYGTSPVNPETSTVYDIGFNAQYRTTSVAHTFTIADGSSTTLNLQADLQQIFTSPTGIDILTQPATNSTNNPEIAIQFADRFAQIFSIQ